MDYASLRQDGVRWLERLSGKLWTDFNAHDPGITILEQLCYALSDLSYRTGNEIPDLLAEGGADPYRDLHRPAAVLTCRPVTRDDLRRLVLDVEGVKNAWIELVDESSPALYYHPDRAELSLTTAALTERISLRGLYRILIEAAEQSGGVALRVAQRLHQSRGLCEDFDELVVLDPQPIQVKARVEIDFVDDLERLRRDIEQRIADQISPPVRFSTLEELQRAGAPVDEIFEGPRLDHGFITDEALQRAGRRTAINVSDLIHAIMDAPGVRAVREITIASNGKDEPWALPVAANRVARLDRAGSAIRLTRSGKELPVPASKGDPAIVPAYVLPGNEPTPPPARSRSVARYWSVQNHLPAIYGVGESGLPDSAPPQRRAQAKQLKAYLMLFDQLMCNYLAQLAHAQDLFAYSSDETRTYFTQVLDQPELGFEELRTPETAALMTDVEAGSHERRSRFLNHLLARFAETIDERSAADPTDQTELWRNKQAFLRAFPRLSGARGTGFDALAPVGPGNRSGLEQRLQLKLGLREDKGETFLLIEHILLRPMKQDAVQELPLLAAVKEKDPYSLKLSLVFPCGVGRFPASPDERSDFQSFVEQVVREETPAHLIPYVKWVAARDFAVFQATHAQWMERRRRLLTEQLNANLPETEP